MTIHTVWPNGTHWRDIDEQQPAAAPPEPAPAAPEPAAEQPPAPRTTARRQVS